MFKGLKIKPKEELKSLFEESKEGEGKKRWKKEIEKSKENERENLEEEIDINLQCRNAIDAFLNGKVREYEKIMEGLEAIKMRNLHGKEDEIKAIDEQFDPLIDEGFVHDETFRMKSKIADSKSQT